MEELLRRREMKKKKELLEEHQEEVESQVQVGNLVLEAREYLQPVIKRDPLPLVSPRLPKLLRLSRRGKGKKLARSEEALLIFLWIYTYY